MKSVKKLDEPFWSNSSIEEKIHRYLRRIGLEDKKSPTYEFLSVLQNNHMKYIPFENLSIKQKKRQSDIALSLNIKDLYHKIILGEQGGFCYELNGLFGWLLDSLGFNVSYLAAKVVSDEDMHPGILDHQTLLVDLDQQYLVDVGFGDSFRTPIPLFEEIEENFGVSRKYRISTKEQGYLDPVNNIHYNYSCDKFDFDNNTWVTEYEFSMRELELEDFTDSCKWTETSDDSSFTGRTIVSKATELGRITLNKQHLTITENGNSTKKEIQDDEFYDLLSDHFGISLDKF